jgi:hypothetical protein
MSILRFFFPSLFRQPKVGDKYVHVWDDPFDPLVYTVIDTKEGWVKVRCGNRDCTETISPRRLKRFYKLLP